MSVTVPPRLRLTRAMMEKPLEKRSLEELQGLAADARLPVSGGASREDLMLAITNATRSPVVPPRNGRQEGMRPPRDVRTAVLHEAQPEPVQEGGPASGEAPEGEEKDVPRDARATPTRRRSTREGSPSPDQEE